MNTTIMQVVLRTIELILLQTSSQCNQWTYTEYLGRWVQDEPIPKYAVIYRVDQKVYCNEQYHLLAGLMFPAYVALQFHTHKDLVHHVTSGKQKPVIE
jgi:hypothetical protein